MCLGALRGEHSLKVARRARAGQTFPHTRHAAGIRCTRGGAGGSGGIIFRVLVHLQTVCNIVSAPGVHRASFFFYHPPLVPVFAPISNNLEYLLAVCKNLAHPLHLVYDDGKGGGWKWWVGRFVLLNSHISAYTRCLVGKACGLVQSTWGTSQGEDKLGARDKILNTKVARRANIPPMVHLPTVQQHPLRMRSHLQTAKLQRLKAMPHP